MSEIHINKLRINLIGISVDLLTVDGLFKVLSESIPSELNRIIANHNLHSVYLFHHDIKMRKFYDAAYRIHIDGMSLVYLSKFFGYLITPDHRVTYLDWVYPLMEKCAYERWRVFYLGGKPGIAHTAAHQLRFKYPELQLKTFHGYFNKANQENANVIDMITQFKPNILMVGMGMPLQEVWILENIDKIMSNIILPTGACFDYIADAIPSPPRWIGRIGLEWLFRLASEPERLWRRYLIEPWFVASLVLRDLFKGSNGS